MQEFILQVMNQFGYLGICFLIIIENVFPPIPSEVILFFGGFMTTCTTMKISGVVLFATLGSTMGAMILYEAGCMLSPARLEKLLERKLFRSLGFKKGDVTRTTRWFEHHGKKAVLLGRCVPIIRSLISVPAGMAGLSLPLFLLYTVLGSTVWNLFLVFLGAFLGSSWGVISRFLKGYSSLTALLLAAAFITLLLFFFKKRSSKKEDRR